MTASELAEINASSKVTKTEKLFIMLIRDMGTSPNRKAGTLWPISGWPFYLEGDTYGMIESNGPDCGFKWKIGTDCVIVKRTRKQTVTETYSVVEA